MGFDRFVAVGDSQTEGLWDGDDAAGLAGWADRLALRLAADNPAIEYANLAVRSRRIAEIRDEQLGPALAMKPDLVGICVGMNDVMALNTDMSVAIAEMEEMYRVIAGSGATVVTTLFPDIRGIVPMARFIEERLLRVNVAIRRCAQKYDLRLIDLHSAPSMRDLRMWAPDRIHGSVAGHKRFALAAAEALGLAGADHCWADPLEDVWASSRIQGLRRDALWAASVLGPWTVRRLRGVSTGDGRTARRPQLLPVIGTVAPVG